MELPDRRRKANFPLSCKHMEKKQHQRRTPSRPRTTTWSAFLCKARLFLTCVPAALDASRRRGIRASHRLRKRCKSFARARRKTPAQNTPFAARSKPIVAPASRVNSPPKEFYGYLHRHNSRPRVSHSAGSNNLHPVTTRRPASRRRNRNRSARPLIFFTLGTSSSPEFLLDSRHFYRYFETSSPFLKIYRRQHHRRLRRANVSPCSRRGKLALALVLLIGYGLMVRAFWKPQEVHTE